LAAGAERKDPTLPTVAFVSSKGGVGKTTCALLLALGLTDRGLKVALVDSDPNLPLSSWAALPGKPDDIALFQAPNFADLPAALRGARKDADWIVVDTEGGAPRMAGWAIAEADMVVVPLAASVLEVREVLKIAKLVRQIEQRQRRPIVLACVFARTPSPLRRAFKEISSQLQTEGLTILPTVLSDKEAFRALFAHGGRLQSLNRRRTSGVAAAIDIMTAYAGDVSAALAEAAGPS
jgi:chromosome partitioning protein